MLLSTTTEPLCSTYTYEQAIKIIYQAGFDAYDISLCPMLRDPDCRFNKDDYRQEAQKLRAYSDGLGIVCNQAHAPFHSSCGIPEKDAETFKKITRATEIASILGAKNIVVHPKQHLKYLENREELFKINLEFYKDLIPYAIEFNIKIAIENMWQYNENNHSITESTCSRAKEFCEYIDKINSEWIVGCLDIGHTSLIGADTSKFIHTLGNKRLRALHVHDTDFIRDSHTMPFMEKIDYGLVAKALGEIDYKGDFTFEIISFFKDKPLELLPSFYRLAHDVGRYLINEVEKNR